MRATSTLLGHLVPLLTAQTEDAATKALAFVLNGSPAARRALQSLLPGDGRAITGIARVSTQDVADGSRPDLSLVTEDGGLLGFIEAKFWASLTDAQPVEYLKRLGNERGIVLLIVAPEKRLHSLWAELARRCGDADPPIGLDIPDATAFAARVAGDRWLGLVSWTQVLGAIDAAVGAAGETATQASVAQLEGLRVVLEGEGFVPLTSAELTNADVPRRAQQYADLVDAIVDGAEAANVLSVKGLKATAQRHGYGRYARLQGNVDVWIGVHHALWAAHGVSPVWVCIQGVYDGKHYGRVNEVRSVLRDWLASSPPRAHDELHLAIPIDLPTQREQKAVVDHAVGLLSKLGAHFAEIPVKGV